MVTVFSAGGVVAGRAGAVLRAGALVAMVALWVLLLAVMGEFNGWWDLEWLRQLTGLEDLEIDPWSATEGVEL